RRCRRGGEKTPEVQPGGDRVMVRTDGCLDGNTRGIRSRQSSGAGGVQESCLIKSPLDLEYARVGKQQRAPMTTKLQRNGGHGARAPLPTVDYASARRDRLVAAVVVKAALGLAAEPERAHRMVGKEVYRAHTLAR